MSECAIFIGLQRFCNVVLKSWIICAVLLPGTLGQGHWWDFGGCARHSWKGQEEDDPRERRIGWSQGGNERLPGGK